MCTDAAQKEYQSKEKNGISPSSLEPIEEGGDIA